MPSAEAPLWYLVLPLIGTCTMLVVCCVHVLRRSDCESACGPARVASHARALEGPLSMRPLFVERDRDAVALDGLMWSPTGLGLPVTLRLQLPSDAAAAHAVETALQRWADGGPDITVDVSGFSTARRRVALSHGGTTVSLAAERIITGAASHS
jgi:hypothetical protein